MVGYSVGLIMASDICCCTLALGVCFGWCLFAFMLFVCFNVVLRFVLGICVLIALLG